MAVLSGFSRLKGLFSNSLNFSTYKEIVSTSKNVECGNIPKDMIGILLGKGSKDTIKAEINAVKNAFGEAKETLAHGIEVTQRAQAIQVQRQLSSAFDKSKIISLDFLRNPQLQKTIIESTASTRGIDNAAKSLTESLSKIIPNCAKVEIKPLGSGAYGQGYKIEFLDSNGNKLIHDKVLKVFYEEGKSSVDLLSKMTPLMIEKSKEFMSQFSLKDIITMLNNIKKITVEEALSFLKPYEEILTKQGVTVKPEDIEKGLTQLQSLKLKDLKPIFEMIKKVHSSKINMKMGEEMLSKMKEHMSKMHGVYAEANTMTFLRNRVGHSLRKTNVVAPDYYNLEKGYSIAEYSDELLPAAKSEVNFELLGLQHQDLHQANTVAGRIIDIGGINLTIPELTDKITAKYYKKIMNQKNPELRKKYIEQLEKEIETMNDLDKEKIKKAIRIVA